ncbi:MAG TPA: SDR family oxidoreductase [Polyangia bacterium]|jgi:NAD(P)-dependent dehydrogenase (short-subunit alcohol dehydrogenase family)|nr:SDR family oxidoreductase [Polyangia bacterium]
MRDKVVLITGASNGIGKETAIGLGKLGARLILVCRDRERGTAAVAEIGRKAPDAAGISLRLADLSSQAAVRALAADVLATTPRLDVLINNAGVILQTRTLSPDGIEMQFAVNHLAPFLLTNLLRERLVQSAPARVVTVASQVERKGRIDFDDLQGARRYQPLTAYGQSKLANVLFTYELARRLAGTGVTANCLHPGVIGTKLLADYMGRSGVTGWVANLAFPSAEKGARPSIRAASDPALAGVTGKYFQELREGESSPASYDQATARRLWEVSAAMTGLEAG